MQHIYIEFQTRAEIIFKKTADSFSRVQTTFHCFHSTKTQGEALEMKPEVLLAVDQDFGINATIRYAWNGGTFQTFFLSFSSHSFGWCPHFRVRCPVSSCSLSPPCWQCSRFFDSHPLSSRRSLMARCFGATGGFGTFFSGTFRFQFLKINLIFRFSRR